MRLVRVGPPIAWAAATVVMFALAGVPTSHDLLFSWLLLGMLAFTASDFRKRLPRLVVEWAPLIAILFGMLALALAVGLLAGRDVFAGTPMDALRES